MLRRAITLPSLALHSHLFPCWTYQSVPSPCVPTGKPPSYGFYSTNDQQPSAGVFDQISVTRSLEIALFQRNIEDAWRSLQAFAKVAKLPERGPLNKSLLLFTYQGNELSLTRALRLIIRVKDGNRLDLLDGDALSLLALAYSRANMFDLAGKVVRLLVREHFFPSLNVWTAILEHLSKKPQGATVAAKIFLEICIYIRKGREKEKSTKSVDVLFTMQPDSKAFNLALKACETARDWEKAEQIMNQMCSFSLSPDNACFTSLIKVYANASKMDALNRMLPRLRRAGVVPNQTTMSTLISAFVNLEGIDAAARLVRLWVQAGQNFEDEKLRHTVGASKELPRVVVTEEAKTARSKEYDTDIGILFSYWRSSMGSPDSVIYGIILKGFLGEGRTLDAVQFLIEMQQEESLDYKDCSLAVQGLLQMGLRDEAHAILHAMAAQNAPADFRAYASLLEAYCRIPYPDKAKEVLADAKKVGHEIPLDCHEALIEMHILLQEYEAALSVFKAMKRSGLFPLEPSFQRLLEVFEENSKPNLMKKLLEAARGDSPVRVDVRHWNGSIRSFCKARMLLEAKATVKRMKQLGIEPDAATYAILLNGYYTHGGKVNEMLLLWPEVLGLAAPREGVEPLKLEKDLLDGFLTVFVRYGYFRKALEVARKMEEQKFLIDKIKYMKLYLQYHKHIFTSKHASQRRIDKSQDRRKQNEAFKVWVGLSS